MSDLMLLGVLRMLRAVYPDAPPAEPITWHQVVGRCSEAADRIEADAGAIDRLRAENEELRARIAELDQNDRRYMWIRDRGYQIIGEDRGNGPEWPDAADVDRLVDAQLGASDER